MIINHLGTSFPLDHCLNADDDEDIKLIKVLH